MACDVNFSNSWIIMSFLQKKLFPKG